jgi:predicted GTPase
MTQKAAHESVPLDCISGAQAALQVLRTSSDVEAFFEQEIEWFEERLDIWRSRGWRAGVLGITSGGKSTLLNALFQRELIPARVGPSSNTLILCKRTPEERATIIYQDGTEETVETNVAMCLDAIADEANNPGNTLDIKEIRLGAPDFLVTDDIVLVDTPGLDAYGLQAHEKLTLDIFLPTVDIVLFISSTKANTDDKNRECLERIHKARKPCIFVQNKVDAIEPKLGAGGVEVENREEIRRKHILKSRKLVKRVFGDLEVPVLQVSARDALKGRRETAGLKCLVEAIQAHVEALRPTLESGRLRQLHRELTKVSEQVVATRDITHSRAALQEERASASAFDAAFRAIKNDFQKWARVNKAVVSRETRNLDTELVALRRTHHKKAREISSRVCDWHERAADRLRAMVKKCQNDANDLATKLNLRDEDFRIPQPARTVSHIHLKTRPEKYVKEVWRGGFGFWDFVLGPLSEEATRTVFDIDDFRRQAHEALRQQERWFKQAVADVLGHLNGVLEPLGRQILRMQRGVETREQHLLGQTNRERTRKKLSELCESVSASISTSEPPSTEGSGTMGGPDLSELAYPMTVPSYLPDLLMLADAMRRARCRALRDALMERCEVPEGIAPTVCVWGWDDDAVDTVLQQFFEVNGCQKPTAQPVMQFVPSTRFEHLTVIHERKAPPREEQVFQRDLERLTLPVVLFVVIDIDQPGATQTQIAQSKLHYLKDFSTGFIAVIQSLSLSRTNGPEAFAEALAETLERLSRLGLRPDGILANDQCLGFSFLVDRIYRCGHKLIAQADEVAWVEALGIEQWPERSSADLASGMIRSWRVRNNDNRRAGKR